MSLSDFFNLQSLFFFIVNQLERVLGMALPHTTLERVLGMALPHSIEWIQLYQMFNQGPKLVEQKKGRNINYIVKTKEK